jgi:SAM-dependent methyltransferase
MIETVEFNDKEYPLFQTTGPASQFAIPYAQKVCKGEGYDVGPRNREWGLPGAILIDQDFADNYHALNFPYQGVDYIFSSHCLEHVEDWIETMDYWYESIKRGGVLFLYLPHYSQEYWRPWHNRKHRHVLTPQILKDYMKDRGYKNIFASGVDLNNSFMIMGEKR